LAREKSCAGSAVIRSVLKHLQSFMISPSDSFLLLSDFNPNLAAVTLSGPAIAHLIDELASRNIIRIMGI
jgi:hypothetical protein